MRFDDPKTARTYADREADATWQRWCKDVLRPDGKDVLDVGCGGGIYSDAFRRCGARTVTGVDFSLQYIEEARAQFPGLTFVHASCDDTGLQTACADLIFERALIHHLDLGLQAANAREMYRLLRHGGRAVIQDRTFDDVRTQSEEHWIRRELLRMFPRLLAVEKARRPDREVYRQKLIVAGFSEVTVQAYDEVRRVYDSWEALEADILARKGKSILYELEDGELGAYCRRLADLAKDQELVERDLWTVWIAEKPF